MTKLLGIEGLRTQFVTSDGTVKAVDGISYDVEEGETVAIVGESGCGKSVSALSILRLIPDPPGRIVEGKIRFIGASSTLPNLASHIEMGVFDAFQIPYSALERQHEETITQAAESGAGIILRGGVARGAPSDGKQRGNRWGLWQRASLDELLDGMTRMEFILRFTLSHPALSTTIVGTVNPDHLAANLDALVAGPLPLDLYDEAKRRLTAAESEAE